MAFHASRAYDLITFDEVTPSQGFDSGFPPSAERLSPIQDDLPSWRRSTPAEMNYDKTEKADVASTSGLQETLLRVEQGLASVEKRLHARDSRLYETVEEMAEKLRTLELSQKTRDEELKRVKEQIRVGKTTHPVLRDSDKPLVPSPPESVPRQLTQTSTDLRAVTPQDSTKGDWNHHLNDDGDELWASLEKIDQLARKSTSGAQQPFLPHSSAPSPSKKPRIRPSPYDGVSSWDDYRAQFELVAELNGWDGRTKAIYLAASLQGPARATLGDLDPSKRKDFSALIEALESRFGSKHQTEMYRAQLRCRTRKRDETLPQLAQAIQRLTRQAYPDAPSTLQDTLARDHFIDALPESEVRWRIHQVRPKSLQEALTTALEIEAFYVADRHRARIQARAVFPPPPEAPAPMSPHGNDLQQQVGELRQVVNQLLAKQEQPLRPPDGLRRFGSGYLPGNYSGCFTCGGLDHLQRDCPGRRQPQSGNGSQPGSRAGARLPPPLQGSRPFSQ